MDEMSDGQERQEKQKMIGPEQWGEITDLKPLQLTDAVRDHVNLVDAEAKIF